MKAKSLCRRQYSSSRSSSSSSSSSSSGSTSISSSSCCCCCSSSDRVEGPKLFSMTVSHVQALSRCGFDENLDGLEGNYVVIIWWFQPGRCACATAGGSIDMLYLQTL